MTYDEMNKLWHAEFIKAMQRRNISKNDFLEITGKCNTNGACYYLRTKNIKGHHISQLCQQLGIPLEEVFSLNNAHIFSDTKANRTGRSHSAEQFITKCVYRHKCMAKNKNSVNASKNN